MKDREAWRTAVHELQRDGHNWTTNVSKARLFPNSWFFTLDCPERVFQGKFSRIHLLQTYPNTFPISSPVLAMNGKQYAWIRGPISTWMQFLLFWQQNHLQRFGNHELPRREKVCFAKSFTFVLVLKDLLTREITHYTHTHTHTHTTISIFNSGLCDNFNTQSLNKQIKK